MGHIIIHIIEVLPPYETHSFFFFLAGGNSVPPGSGWRGNVALKGVLIVHSSKLYSSVPRNTQAASPRPAESETLGEGPGIPCFNKPQVIKMGP